MVVGNYFVAAIDGTTAKTKETYDWGGERRAPGFIAADVLARCLETLDPTLEPQDAILALNQALYDISVHFNVAALTKENPIERFSASIALTNLRRKEVILAGDCQAVIDSQFYQVAKDIDRMNANARSAYIMSLVKAGGLTDAALRAMDPETEPGRLFLLEPPPHVPGVKGQHTYQNKAGSKYDYLVLDGSDNLSLGQLVVIPFAENAKIILATDGYPVAHGFDPVTVLDNLEQAEAHLVMIIEHDPCCYTLYPSTKGKGSKKSFDDRAYIAFMAS